MTDPRTSLTGAGAKIIAPKPQSKLDYAEFLLSFPLYKKHDIEGDEAWLLPLRVQGHKFMGHCVRCKDLRSFEIKKLQMRLDPVAALSHASANGPFAVRPECFMCGTVYQFNFLKTGNTVQKIGQYPSLEDITGHELDRYRKQLRDGMFEELHRANGLASHGVGIGAFVYLRRIFERLIDEHRREFELNGGNIEGFDSMRMSEKIDALRTVLPKSLVKHRSSYGILSKGLHELSEDECLDYFPAVRAAIIQILEEDWRETERKKTEAQLEREIAAITSSLDAKA